MTNQLKHYLFKYPSNQMLQNPHAGRSSERDWDNQSGKVEGGAWQIQGDPCEIIFYQWIKINDLINFECFYKINFKFFEELISNVLSNNK